MSRDAQLLAQAHDLLRQRRLPEAEYVCRRLLEHAPRSADAVHLLGLLRKDQGDAAGGERLLLQSIALQPGRAEFHANLGNLQRGQRRLAEAAVSYRSALQLNPSQRSARLALCWTLRDQGETAAAEAECRVLLTHDVNDAQAWTALATVLRQALRPVEAEAAYRKALLLKPDYGVARHNLGALLCQLERAEEALVELDRARAQGVSSRELWVNRGHTLLKLHQLDAAEQAYVRASELDPQDADAQLSLARLRYMVGDQDFARGIRAAAHSHPGAVPLQLAFAHLLRSCDDLTGAEAQLQRLLLVPAAAADAHCALSGVLLEQGRFDSAEAHASSACQARPQSTAAVENLVRVQLVRGQLHAVASLLRAQRLHQPGEQRWIAYESIAARLAGDPRYAELCDYQQLVRCYDVPTPRGWRSMQELNEALSGVLAKRHLFARHPFDQSLRNGSQTTTSLLVDSDRAIHSILEAFAGPLHEYTSSIRTAPDHPLQARNRGLARIDKCWSVQLHCGGFHVNHIHPEGWISSAYYVDVPAEASDPVVMSGWIKFGEPALPVPGCTPERLVQPRPGMLVLFPSYVWHGTTAIHGTQPRTTIAFDAVPG